jgi:putative tryptophan/tyrosine transport system substrate-binding protein
MSGLLDITDFTIFPIDDDPRMLKALVTLLQTEGGMRRRDFIGLLGGAAATWPIASHAQQSAVPLIGYLSGRSPEDTVRELEAFHKGLSEGGFVSGGNVNVEYRWARGDYDRLTALAAELVQRRVAVLAATGGDASAITAKEATCTAYVR